MWIYREEREILPTILKIKGARCQVELKKKKNQQLLQAFPDLLSWWPSSPKIIKVQGTSAFLEKIPYIFCVFLKKETLSPWDKMLPCQPGASWRTFIVGHALARGGRSTEEQSRGETQFWLLGNVYKQRMLGYKAGVESHCSGLLQNSWTKS